MASTIKIKRSSVAGKKPTTSDIATGELALNTKDFKLFSSNGTTIFELGNAGALANTNAYIATKAPTASPTFTGTLSAPLIAVTQSLANEGGQIDFSLPSSGSTLSGTVAIDVYQNQLRIFETGGTNRGAYIDLTTATAGVGSNLLAGGGGSAANGFSGILVGANVVVADSTTDRLTLVAGSKITLAGNPTTDTITIAAQTTEYLQVANAVSTYQTKAVERAALANTNAYIATRASWSALTGTNTALRTLINDRYQVANVNTLLAAKATWTGLTGTNTALRTLINDRLQVANASTLYATKSNPTTSGLFAHTGRATISTNLTVSGNTSTNKATVTSALTVSGNTTLGAASKTITSTGAWTHTGTGSISTNLTVSGNTSLAAVTASGLATMSGRATVGTNLTVSGNTTLGAAGKTITSTGLLAHTGRATISTNLAVSGNSAISGNETITGTLTVNGATTLGDATTDLTTISGRATIGTNLTVSGNTTISGTLNASSVYLNGTVYMRGTESSQTLTDAVTIAWDTNSGRIATVTLAGNRTVGAPTNAKVGTYVLHVIQDATGSRTLTWNGVFKWPGGVAPVLTTTANARDVFTFVNDGTNFYGSYINDVK